MKLDIPIVVPKDCYTVIVVQPKGDGSAAITIADFGNDLPLNTALTKVAAKVRRAAKS